MGAHQPFAGKVVLITGAGNGIGRATAILPYDEQIPGERYRQGERVRALLLRVDEGVRGTFIRLSRSHPKFLVKLFEAEVPEYRSG